MAIKTRDEILAMIKGALGEDVSDENIAIYEDISDTFNDYDARLSDTTDWRQKYEDNDAEWRKRYTERFMSGEDIVEKQEEHIVEEDNVPRTFDELFKEREG